MKSTPLNEEELKFVDNILMKYGNDDSILSISELDGFLTAIVSGPRMIMPSEWVPVMWGGSGREPAWEREDEFQRFFPLVMQHMNNNSTMLMECPDDFEGLFPQREVDGKIYRVVDDWCEGYLKGVHMDHDGWMKAPKKIIEDHLSVMHVFGSGEHDDMLDQLSADGISTLQDKVEKGAIAMHAYFLQLRSCAPPSPVFNKPAPISVSPSVGRNAPCPCGSGKKYKKCCLQ